MEFKWVSKPSHMYPLIEHKNVHSTGGGRFSIADFKGSDEFGDFHLENSNYHFQIWQFYHKNS